MAFKRPASAVVAAAKRPSAAAPAAAHTAPSSAASDFAALGFAHLRGAAAEASLLPLLAEVEAASPSMTAGGYVIWSPASALPPALREWSETEGAALLLSAVSAPSSRPPRCCGGAALFKTAGLHGGTPFHQDKAYSEKWPRADGASLLPATFPAIRAAPDTVGRAAVWLALSNTGRESGCLRFAPSLGFALLSHHTLPRAEAPSGFETFLAPEEDAAAAAAAYDVPMSKGDAIIIGPSVVHGANPAVLADRIAFSPLYEW